MTRKTLETTLVSVTTRVGEMDPSAVVFGLRRAREPWFCWEQPDAGFALATLGSVCQVVSRGPERFRDVAAEIAARAGQGSEGVPGAGPVWVGGFAFDSHGATEPHWSSCPPALMTLPEIAILRVGAETFLTVNGRGEGAIERSHARIDGRGWSLPLLDPAPSGRFAIGSTRSPEQFERAVAVAVERIERGELEKAVLAREVVVEAPAAYDPAALFGALRELFPSCYCFCCGTPEAAFLGASPELLARRRGASAATVALAGSARRSADPAVDDHLGEQLLRSSKERSEHEIVARRIERSLRPHAVWVERAAEPELIRVANVQHLATPIHAQLAEPRSAVELAGLLHPTPAVGGEPADLAAATIAELEELDRGWYAGPVGWMDATEDGEFCVALRSALLRDRTARLYAGAGIVAGSDPAAELAETEVKLEALLPLVTG